LENENLYLSKQCNDAERDTARIASATSTRFAEVESPRGLQAECTRDKISMGKA
jgi:hypothetical protein